MSDAPIEAGSVAEAPDEPEVPVRHDDAEGLEPEIVEQVAFDIATLPGGARGALEAVLMVVDEPITSAALASALELPLEDVERHLHDLEEEYAGAARGFCLKDFAGGWRFYSRSEYAAVVEKFLLDGQQAKLSQAALETLAVVAYRQPVSRGRVSSVRGVNVDGVMRTLTSRGLIQEVDHDPETGALRYGTTDYFLARMGMRSLDDLPALAPYLPDTDMLDQLAEEAH